MKQGALQPHRWRYGLTPQPEADFDTTVIDVCTLYRNAPTLAPQGERVVSTDALTGVQALERQPPGLPMAAGKVERREFEYIRQGTCTFILTRDVVTGQVLAPSAGPTRTEAAFLAQVQGVVATEPQAARGHCVVDNLDTHRSASLVQWVAEVAGLTEELGVQGKSGIWAARQSRASFWGDPRHRVVFHDTPKYSAWLKQIEIWLSIVVRKLLKRGSFLSVEDLNASVLAFIEYDNRTMAKPFKRTYQGKPLML